jgi:hypothetical protein
MKSLYLLQYSWSYNVGDSITGRDVLADGVNASSIHPPQPQTFYSVVDDVVSIVIPEHGNSDSVGAAVDEAITTALAEDSYSMDTSATTQSSTDTPDTSSFSSSSSSMNSSSSSSRAEKQRQKQQKRLNPQEFEFKVVNIKRRHQEFINYFFVILSTAIS